jgi:hypothetical protein
VELGSLSQPDKPSEARQHGLFALNGKTHLEFKPNESFPEPQNQAINIFQNPFVIPLI